MVMVMVMVMVMAGASPAAAQPKKHAAASAPAPAAPTASAAAAAPAGPRPLSESLTGDAKADYDAARLLVGNGDWVGAEIKLQAAYDRSGDPRLLWNIAACEKSQRHYARTMALVERYLADGKDLVTPADRAEATTLLQAIESFTVKLTVAVSEPGADVYVDDEKVGTSPLDRPVVVDIGARKITVRKPGFKEWAQSVPIGGSAEARVDVKLEPEVHEGHLVVTTQPDARILIDDQPVGANGRFEGKLKSGGHQLRVEAPGMVPYQSEVVLGDDENRSVDVPLEHEYAPPPAEPAGPGVEIGVSDAPGVRLHGDDPWMNAARVDVGWRAGRPTNLGLFLEEDEIDASGDCGTGLPAAATAPPLGLEQRWSFKSCRALKAGLQVVVHFLPAHRIDPWFGVEPGFRLGIYHFTVFDPLSGQSNNGDDVEPNVDLGARAGVDWHPLASFRPWAIGVFGSVMFSIAGEPKANNSGCCGDTQNGIPVGAAPNENNGNNNGGGGGPDTYLSVFFGLRTSLAF